MTPTKLTAKKPEKSERSIIIPLVIAALVLLVIVVGVMLTSRTQRPDPTLTAAPPSGHIGALVQPSSDKMAKEQQIQASMNAQIAAMKKSSH